MYNLQYLTLKYIFKNRGEKIQLIYVFSLCSWQTLSPDRKYHIETEELHNLTSQFFCNYKTKFHAAKIVEVIKIPLNLFPLWGHREGIYIQGIWISITIGGRNLKQSNCQYKRWGTHMKTYKVLQNKTNSTMLQTTHTHKLPLYRASRGKQQFGLFFLNPSHQQGWCQCPEPRRTVASSDPQAGRDGVCPLCCPGTLADAQTLQWAERYREVRRHSHKSLFEAIK